MQPVIITGQTGPYNPQTPKGWGQNTSHNFKKMNEADKFVPKYEIHYSKPQNPVAKFLKGVGASIQQLFTMKAVNPNINRKSLFGYAEEDLKGLDTDNDGRVTPPENAAFVLFQDMLDRHPFLGLQYSVELKTSDADDKITNIGVTNSQGLLNGKSKDRTKQTLLKIRKDFELDKNG